MAIGPQEITIIVIVVVLLFGATAIPKLARSLGKAQGEFKKARSEFDSELKAGEKLSDGPPEEQIRRTAKELGIDESGMTLAEVKTAINDKLA